MRCRFLGAGGQNFGADGAGVQIFGADPQDQDHSHRAGKGPEIPLGGPKQKYRDVVQIYGEKISK